MLKAARVGMAVSQGKGCAVEAIFAADVHVTNANSGLDLLLQPKRLKATLTTHLQLESVFLQKYLPKKMGQGLVSTIEDQPHLHNGLFSLVFTLVQK